METLYTQREAASVSRLSERTLERVRVSGLAPKFLRAQRSIRYRQSDLEEWIAAVHQSWFGPLYLLSEFIRSRATTHINSHNRA